MGMPILAATSAHTFIPPRNCWNVRQVGMGRSRSETQIGLTDRRQTVSRRKTRGGTDK